MKKVNFHNNFLRFNCFANYFSMSRVAVQICLQWTTMFQAKSDFFFVKLAKKPKYAAIMRNTIYK